MYDDILGKEVKKEEGKGKKAKLGIAPEDRKDKKPARIAPTPSRPVQGQGLGTPIKKKKNVLKQPIPVDNKCPDCGDSLDDCDCEDEFDENDKWDAGGSKSSGE
jgi:hypothetical protein